VANRHRDKRCYSSRYGYVATALLTSTFLTGAQPAMAQEQKATAPAGDGLQEIVVTARKTNENLQNVPLAVQALGQATLEQHDVQSVDDYMKLMPSINYSQSEGTPGRATFTMRGIASGYRLGVGQSPLVGTYIDEIPTTTREGSIDLHIYDVARIEALSGPQGTIYGASSEAGTLKIVTNKPDTTRFSAGYDVNLNDSKGGAFGDVVEGFVNQPISDHAAIRIVGFQEHDGGYIDNVPATITYPSTGYSVSNASQVKKNYNPTDTEGGRAALKIDLNDDWTALVQVMGQDQHTSGFFGYLDSLGVDKTAFHLPQKSHDSFWSPALTITGKVGDFDLTVVSSYLRHDIRQTQDYTDYSLYYDKLYDFAADYAYGIGGVPIDAGQTIREDYNFDKYTNEIRYSSPSDKRFRSSGGAFAELQIGHLSYNQIVAGTLDPSLTVQNTFPNTIWLSEQHSRQQDYALYNTFEFDLLPNLTFEAGGRVYKYIIDFDDFSGGNDNPATFQYPAGIASCISSKSIIGSPCTDVSSKVTGSGVTYKAGVTWRVDPHHMVYFNTSTGYRPGGFNQQSSVAPYQAEKLINYEVGWKTSWFDNHLRWNGDLFYDPWNNFQFNFRGANGITQVANAGAAVSKGVETNLSWQATSRLTISGDLAYTDARLTKNYCGTLDASGSPITNCAAPQAPKGTKLPVTPTLKGDVTARYEFEAGDSVIPYVQASAQFRSGSWNYLQTDVGGVDPRAILGRNPGFTQVDLAAGVKWGSKHAELYVKNAFNVNGELNRYVKCGVTTCAGSVYVTNVRPLMIGFTFGQRF
jgi:iron complex outermembrane recepter protein